LKDKTASQLLIWAYLYVLLNSIVRMYFFDPRSDLSRQMYNFFAYFPIFHIPQFLFGAALGRLYLSGALVSSKAYPAVFLASSTALMLIFGLGTGAPIWMRSDALLVIPFALLILSGAMLQGALRQMLSWAPLLLFGEASYAMYILHEPLYFWWKTTKKHAALSFPPIEDFLIYTAVVVIFSTLTYLYIERPSRRWIVRRYSPDRVKLATT